MRLASHEGVCLVGIDQVGRAVADYTGTAGVDKGLDTSLGGHSKKRLCSVDINLVQDLVGHVELGAGRVDDDAGLDLDEQLAHGTLIGEVSEVVLAALDGLGGRSQVHGRELGACIAFKQEVDDLCTQSTASSSDEHMAQILGRCRLATDAAGWSGHCAYVVWSATERGWCLRGYQDGATAKSVDLFGGEIAPREIGKLWLNVHAILKATILTQASRAWNVCVTRGDNTMKLPCKVISSSSSIDHMPCSSTKFTFDRVLLKA